MRASQFIDFINRKEMPTKEEQDIHYTHIDLETKKYDKVTGKMVNTIKETRRKYRLRINQK